LLFNASNFKKIIPFFIVFLVYETGITQKIEATENAVYLKTFLQKYEEEKDIHIYYESAILDEILVRPGITSSTHDPFEFLSEILKDTKLYVKEISEQAFVIKPKLKVGVLYGSIRGSNGIGLPGATVLAEETDYGSAANINGEYTLTLY